MIGHRIVFSSTPIRKLKGGAIWDFVTRGDRESSLLVLARLLINQLFYFRFTYHDSCLIAGLDGPHIDTTDRNSKCQTCGEEMAKFSGYFGHIEHAWPVFHSGE